MIMKKSVTLFFVLIVQLAVWAQLDSSHFFKGCKDTYAQDMEWDDFNIVEE